jgi:uncharacterized membrane protein
MSKGRLEAFSDGVIAILITIMVLSLDVPKGSNWADLRHVIPRFLTYLLSFVVLGIYWNNHHHMLQAASRVNGAILWANLHLLFWLSLFPFFTSWMGTTHFAELPVSAYGAVLLLAAIAYYVLQMIIVSEHGPDSTIAQAVGRDLKGKISPALYTVAIPLAFVDRWISVAIYALVALMWFVPDRRLETRLQ